MSTQNIIYSQRTTEASPSAAFREKARVFIYRNRVVASLELLMLALLFVIPFFTFSSGILGFPFVLLHKMLVELATKDYDLQQRVY